VAGAGTVPRIVVIDRNFILQRSSAGQDMISQSQNLSKQAETQFKAEEAALQTEMGQLQQQLAILAPDVRDQKEKDFTAKQQAFQAKVQQRQAEIQAGFNKAARSLEVALEPILKTIMMERGANMVLDRTSVILSSVDVDVTPVAVQRLDKALPHVKVELTAVPATAAARPAGVPALTPAAAAVKK
jgi:Skp family chaperone for outer membrane proteins